MAFTPRLNSNGMQGNPWWYSNNNIYYASGYGLPNCTCYAYGRYAEIRNAFANLPSGDGGQWYDAATNFNRGSVPKLGAVACYKSRSGTYAGHVAIVEVINADGTIVTSNSAYNGTYFWTDTVSPGTGYCPAWATTNRDYYCQGFIYNDTGGTEIATNAWVIAAICGVWNVESNCNPGAWESLIVCSWDYVYSQQTPNKGGYGLGQWTNTNPNTGMRLLAMHNWLNSNGYSDDDGNGQMQYFITENLWFNKPQTLGNYSTLTEFLETDSNNISDLVMDFVMNWEGGDATTTLNWATNGDPYAIQRRIDKAIEAYAYIQQHYNDNPNDYTWIYGNRYLTNDEWLNNVMIIYFWLNGTPPTKKRRKSIVSSPTFMQLITPKILIKRGGFAKWQF